MEDLDPGRVRPGVDAEQLADLAALGLTWDESVVRQSERGERYAAALAALEADDLLYPCWCTRAEIREAASAPHGPFPDGAYPGTCASLSREQRADRERSSRPAALRFRAGGAHVAVDDLLLGRSEYAVDDPVVRRGDGAVAYNLAVVVDDAAQGVTQVVRGDDLLETTPRQLLLARALGLPEPAYAHVPLVLGPDGQRLAKRHGGVTLAQRRERGETPEQVRGWMAASAGLAQPGEDPSLETLLGRFDPAAIRREPTVWQGP